VPSLAFWTSATTINQGECATLSWDVQNIQAVWVYPVGQPYSQFPVTGQGSQQVCPQQTTTYEMRVLLRDNSVQTQQIAIQVNVVNPLANSSWTLATLYGAAPVPESSPMIFFYDDGRVSVNGGCNTFNGSYQVSNELISIGPLAGSLVLCGEPIDSQETLYLNAVQSAVTYELNAGQLILRDGSGQEVARFNRIG
jgi:heat shock protein HslJ